MKKRIVSLKKQCTKAAASALLWMLIGASAGCAEEPAVFMAADEENGGQSSTDMTEAETDAESFGKQIVVYICGEVAEPGVYALGSGERIERAVELAGGFTEEAATEAVNLAQEPEDGQMIRIPDRQEWEAASDTGTDGSGRISLNRAGEQQLMSLPGIGEAKARAIIAYREEHGGFRSIEELMKISGIKEGLFQKIKNQITI